MTATPALQVEGLHKSFGKAEVLKGIDLTLAPHDVVCLIGRPRGLPDRERTQGGRDDHQRHQDRLMIQNGIGRAPAAADYEGPDWSSRCR